MKQFLTAVELSTTKVSVAVGEKPAAETGEKSSAKIKVVAHCTVPLPKGIIRGEVVNAQMVIDALKKAIKTAEEETSTSIKKIVLCQSSQFLRCEDFIITQNRSINKDSFITKDEVSQLTKQAEGRQVSSDEKIFAAIPQSYNVDNTIGIAPSDIVGTRGGSSIEAVFKLFIGKKSSFDYKMDIAHKCNLEVIHTVLSPIGSALATIGENEAENGVALLDIGAGTTDIIIVKDNVIRYLGIIPFGGKVISDDIKNVTNITFQHAEYIKTKYGRAVEDGTPENKKLIIPGTGGSPETNIQLTKLSAIIEARLTEIFEAAAYHIEKSGYADKIAGMVITGGTCYMDEIKILAKMVTGYTTRLANAQGKIDDKSAESCFDTYSSSIIGCLYDSYEKGIDNKLSDNLFGFEPVPKDPPGKGPDKGKGKLQRHKPKEIINTIVKSIFDDNNNKA